MMFSKKSFGGTTEILASDDYQAIPVTLSGTSVVKAGSPIKITNDVGAAILAGTGASGILLNDVDPSVDPNGALLVDGIVDWAKCKSHSGATATAAAMAAILPKITFRENIGVYVEPTDTE